jgi:death on curing protein
MIEWVSKSVVLAIHDEQIAEHGGSSGLRDPGSLESALARAQNLQAHVGPAADIAALAAAYAFGIAKNHAFIDGNKRTSAVVTRTFLLLNGYDVTADDAIRIEIWTRLGAGSLSEEACAEWLRANIVKT